MGRKIFSLGFFAAIVLSAALLLLGGLNIHQKRKWAPPDDGCSWQQSDRGVEAQLVMADGPAARAGIQPGDVLRAVNGLSVESDRHVTQLLYEVGVWQRATYTVERDGAVFDATLILAPPSDRLLRRQLYLEIIGLLYFLIGTFVLVKRFGAPLALHFHLVCLVSFVVYVFHYTGKLNGLDWTVFWLGLIAHSLLPPLFLHFCMEFPVRKPFVDRHRRWLPLVYAPGALLLAAWVGFVSGLFGFVDSPLRLMNLLEASGDFHLGAYFVIGGVLLFWTYRTARTPELRQQMKWVTRGTMMSVVPYFLLQSVPRAIGVIPDALADIAMFPLVLMPASFGYAIQRYRLMDVDIIFKRGVTYTLATASSIGLYATLVVLVGELLGSGFESVGTVEEILATIVAALLFSPIKDQFQVWLDKFFYRERYNLRRTLIDFGRTLGSEVRSETMLASVVDRVSRALSVDGIAVFLEDPPQTARFVPVLTSGVEIPPDANLAFLPGSTGWPFLFFESDRFGLNHFIPCHVKDRVIAYIGLSRTKKGDYLTSEDLELLEAVSDYVGIALENARLYKSLEQKAAEYHDLKDFSENIIESISVGVVVEDFEGRIVGWNRALENLTGRPAAETLGARTDAVIPGSFLQRLSEHGRLYKQLWNGLTVNFSVTSLLDKSGAPRGRLIMIDDITDRVRLEDQLIQNEKLTSIGLLAAGVAHEVNTPLAVISSYSQMLRKQISPEDPRHKLLEKITKQTFRASEIVNSLLSFSRMHATEFSEVNVHQVINETISLLEHQFRTNGIRVSAELSADAPVTLGNPGKLQQVFLNLFLNAKDAMTEGGELRIRTQVVDSKIEIVISDTGVGISAENIKKIYDPFFTTKGPRKGTGLGLSVSYGIVQEHGGAISVESKLGRGTSFKLEFPLSRKVVNV